MAGLSIQVWACLDGSGTIGLLDDLNVDSAVDNGVGDYTFNIGTDFANAFCSVAGMGMKTGAVSAVLVVVGLERQGTTNPAAGSFRLEVLEEPESPVDVDILGAIASGTP